MPRKSYSRHIYRCGQLLHDEPPHKYPLSQTGRAGLKVLAIIARFPPREAAMPEPRACPDRRGTCGMAGTGFRWCLLTPARGKPILEPPHPRGVPPTQLSLPGLWGIAALSPPSPSCLQAGVPAPAGPDPRRRRKGRELPPAPAPPLAFPGAQSDTAHGSTPALAHGCVF